MKFRVERADYYIFDVEANSEEEALEKVENEDEFLSCGDFNTSEFSIVDTYETEKKEEQKTEKIIIKITKQEANEIIEIRKPKGSFYFEEDDVFVAIDNLTGDAWTEEFDTKEKAIEWLKGDEEK